MKRRAVAGIGRLRDQSGAALVVALLTIVVMVLLTAALVVASMTETFSAQTAEDSSRAFLVADAAAARAIASLRLDPNWSDDRAGGAEGQVGCAPELYDVLLGACMRDTAYPAAGAVVVSPATPPGGSSEPRCAAAPVSAPASSPSPVPPGESFGRYTVTVVERTDPNTVKLRAVGRVGRASRGFEFTVQRVTPADFVSYSALRVDATRVGNGTFRIHGSVYVRGNWEFHGNSQQLNDRPTSEGDTSPYDNQTFVCSDLVLNGNPQIGEAPRPMLGVHIAGSVIPRGSAYEIHALLQDKVVPDIRLSSVPHAVACIRGGGGGLNPPANNTYCDQNFPGLWGGYTNELDLSGSPARLVVLNRSDSAWVEARATDLALGGTAWRIPKRGRTAACRSHPVGAPLNEVLADCAAVYDGSALLYVAARQTIYVPGALSVARDVDYRVDDDPSQACNPAAGEEADPCRKGDGSLFVVACEGGTLCDPTRTSPAYGLDVQEMLRAHRYASNGPLYPATTFPSRDLLAILVNGKVRFGLSGNPAQQEINLAVLSGCATSLPPDRCDLTMQKNLQLYGSVISRLLVFEQNVDLYQVPDLRRYLPVALDTFLNAPGGSAVVVTQWRELGF